MRAILFVCLGCAFLFQTTTTLTQASGDQAAFRERQAERTDMVREGMQGPGRTRITDPAVLAAMERVPRHLFVPPDVSRYAYRDSALPIGHGQTISQPYIVALMTQALDLKPGMKVLEVGTGSGYQAAVLAEITPEVFTIEIVKALYERTGALLKKLGLDSVRMRLGDGYYGWPEFAPFDRIIVTCSIPEVPPPLFDQLIRGGRMIIPVGESFETQRLLLVSKDEKGGRTSRIMELVRFVPRVPGTTEK
jgi:protein-L-isoaspartate(D-aspartate) O-methyltransferase